MPLTCSVLLRTSVVSQRMMPLLSLIRRMRVLLSAVGTKLSIADFVAGLPWIADFVGRMLPPNFAFMEKLIRPAIETVQIALSPVALPPDKLEWVLMDYGAFVVHVFDEPTRAFYRLDRLWGDRPKVEWNVA